MNPNPAAYTVGWRARRDDKPRDSLSGVSEFQGWDDADWAIKCGRDIGWSKGTDGQLVGSVHPTRRLVQR